MKQTSPIYKISSSKKEEIKMLNELWKTIDRNADHCNKTVKLFRNFKEKPIKIQQLNCWDETQIKDHKYQTE